MTDESPKWRYKCPESFARWIETVSIIKLQIETEWHSEDSWSNHFVAVAHDDEIKQFDPKWVYGMDGGADAALTVNWTQGASSFIKVTIAARKLLEEIDRYKRTNERDLREYKRLKEKFKDLVL